MTKPTSTDTFSPGPTPKSVRSVDGKVLPVPSGWILLPPGDAVLSRRVKAAGDHWLVQKRKEIAGAIQGLVGTTPPIWYSFGLIGKSSEFTRGQIMARQNRRDIFNPLQVGIFHCIQRTVRNCWLCGVDPRTGKSFEHRRQWIQDKLEELAHFFGIDCLSFCVMSTHLHVILRNRPDVVETFSDDEVARRWWQLFPQRRNADGTASEPTEHDLKSYAHPKRVAQLRHRLSDISWWMRALAEPIARRSNAEENLSGRFWQGRFKSQKLADETAVLACSAYVDLNPVRAGVAQTPEESQYTSVYERIAAEQEARNIEVPSAKRTARQSRANRRAAERAERQRQIEQRSDAWLAPVTIDERSQAYSGAMPSKNGCRASDKGFLAMSLESYLKLLDWTGRQLRSDGKRGRIPAELAPILERLGISSGVWCDVVKRFGKIFQRVAGGPEALAREASERQQGWHQTHGSPLASAGDSL